MVLPMTIRDAQYAFQMFLPSPVLVRSLLGMQESPSSCAKTFYQHHYFYKSWCPHPCNKLGLKLIYISAVAITSQNCLFFFSACSTYFDCTLQHVFLYEVIIFTWKYLIWISNNPHEMNFLAPLDSSLYLIDHSPSGGKRVQVQTDSYLDGPGSCHLPRRLSLLWAYADSSGSGNESFNKWNWEL